MSATKNTTDPGADSGIGPSRPWAIALIAAIVLILELAFIRQIPAEVRAIAYFTNLLLMAAFFGLGLGCILQKQRSLAWLLPVGLALTFGFIFVARGLVVYEEATAVHYWLDREDDLRGRAIQIPLFVAAVAAFVFAAAPFVALGQMLARTMDRYPRLVAYSWDIAGSLIGTLLFSVASYVQVPPWVWPPLAMLVWAAVFVRSWTGRVVHVLVGASFLLLSQSSYESRWSPYYLVQYQMEGRGLRVWVNSSFHQFAIDFASNEPADAAWKQEMMEKFSLPYELYRRHHQGRSPREVLLLGAGTGNDVNVALANGAERIVAVEIDPVILELGRRMNTSRPYADPRVRHEVDDARRYLRTARDTFDLVIFGTLDSQTLLSGHANLRLENYVYTRESFEDVKRLLKDGGMMAAYYSVYRPWLYGRIYSTVRQAFGERSRLFPLTSSTLFNTLIVAAPGIPGLVDDPERVERYGRQRPSTDDWPFVYLERPTIAPIYVKLLAVVGVLIAGVFFLLRRVHPVTGLHANFLFLGVGFTLMESAVIVRLALVFGGTWVVNAVVFGSVLTTIFVANFMVLSKRAPSLTLGWVGVCSSALLNYLFPVHALFHLPFAARVAACAVLIGLPVYFAAVCFSRLFGREPSTGYPLGMNLVGAMGGGLLEYTSMVIGMRSVWLIVLAVYLAAFLSTVLIWRRQPVPGIG